MGIPSRQQLILDHYHMVRTIARRMARRYPDSVDVDDLVSIGVLGLIDCADRYAGDRCGTFLAYARIRVQGAIIDAMRKSDFVPRSVRTRARHIADTRARLRRGLGRAPTTLEVAREYRLTPDKFESVERHTQVFTLISLDEATGSSEERLGDNLAAAASHPVEDTTTQIRVRGALSQLPDRDQKIVHLHYYEDQSFREIGTHLGVTESRVSQLHTRIRRTLHESLAA